jgi:general secretion pathway protein M
MMANLRHAMQQRWLSLSAREQRGLQVVGVLLLVVVAWQVLIAPAQNKLRQAESQRLVVAQQLAHMQTLQAQAQVLQQRAPMSRDNALKALQGFALPSGMQLNPQGERVLVTLKAVPAHAVSEWLMQARTQAQALPSEAHLTRTPSNPATSTVVNNTTPSPSPAWDGNLVLVLPRGAQAGGL